MTQRAFAVSRARDGEQFSRSCYLLNRSRKVEQHSKSQQQSTEKKQLEGGKEPNCVFLCNCERQGFFGRLSHRGEHRAILDRVSVVASLITVRGQ